LKEYKEGHSEAAEARKWDETIGDGYNEKYHPIY
jgi:hypothetical protein